MHGGGFVVGTPEVGNRIASEMAKDLGIVVVSVDYRVAPEDPFPAALDDCYAVLTWLHKHAADLGVDTQRIAVGGGSAGGGLAASLAQLAFDRNGPSICFQLLEYPMLDDRTATRTDGAARSALVWTLASNRFGWRSYLGQEPGGEAGAPYASAARREDLAGLPPAWIGVGDIDLLYDENVAYATRLRVAGVEVTLDVVPGMYHGADDIRPDAPSMIEFRSRMYAAIGQAIGQAPEQVQERSTVEDVIEAQGEPRRQGGERRPTDRARSLRSWGLHTFVVAGAVGAVSLDRRLRVRWPSAPMTVTPAVAMLANYVIVRSLEVRRPHDKTWSVQRSELPTDAGTAVTTVATSTVVAAVAEALLARTGSTGGKRFEVSRRSPAAGAVIALVAYDLFHSRLHQLMHVWGAGWRLHSVHHSPKRLNSTNTVRFQFLEIVLDNAIEALVLDRLGLSRDQHVAYAAVRASYAQLQHCNIDLRSGPLDHVMSTPDLHRWHHSTRYEEGDTNFGSVLSVWDKVFGTWFRPNDRECPDDLGIGRMPDFPTRYIELQRVPIDWSSIRERNAATWYATTENVNEGRIA